MMTVFQLGWVTLPVAPSFLNSGSTTISEDGRREQDRHQHNADCGQFEKFEDLLVGEEDQFVKWLPEASSMGQNLCYLGRFFNTLIKSW